MCSDYDYVRHGWILEAMREIRTVRMIGTDLINFHGNLNGMFYGEKRKSLLDNLVRSLRKIVRYAEKSKVHVMLENVPLSNVIHDVVGFKYIIDNASSIIMLLQICSIVWVCTAVIECVYSTMAIASYHTLRTNQGRSNCLHNAYVYSLVTQD